MTANKKGAAPEELAPHEQTAPAFYASRRRIPTDDDVPRDDEAELGVVGSLIGASAAEVLAEIQSVGLLAEHFYSVVHRAAYVAVCDTLRHVGELDAQVFLALLQDEPAFQSADVRRHYLEQVTAAAPIALYGRWFAERVIRAYRRREALAILDEQRERLRDAKADVAAVVDFTTGRLAKVVGTGERTRRGDNVSQPVIVRMCDVKPEAVRWLWRERIALGKLTIIAGDPGLGKSFLSCDLAARVTLGSVWPDDALSYAPKGGVVMLNCEDGLADTIRPRLDCHGADVRNIVALSAVRDVLNEDRQRQFDLSRDLPALEQAIVEVGECRLVVIDPVTAYLGDRHDSHKAADVRALLAPLGELAARHDVAVVGISHLNKGNGPAMYRTMGSLAFIAAARAAWCVTRDRQNPARRLFLPVKNNLGNDSTGLAYSIVDDVVAWERDPVTVTADEALHLEPERRGPNPGERSEAEAFLAAALAGGPRPVKELESEARDGHGLSMPTLRRAQKELGIIAYRPTIPGPWWWRRGDPKGSVSNMLSESASEQLDHLEHLA